MAGFARMTTGNVKSRGIDAARVYVLGKIRLGGAILLPPFSKR